MPIRGRVQGEIKLILILSFVIVIFDQLSKKIVLNLSAKLPIDLVGGVFSINLVRNKGAAFGMLQNKTDFFIIISIITILAILYINFFILRKKNIVNPLFSRFSARLALSLILGGAIGNLIDRVAYGYVIDFLDFKIWPVFNIADASISIGAFIFVYNIIFPRKIINAG